MKMSELKKGDIISNVRYGFKLHKAKVINNFPSKNKIYLKIYASWVFTPLELFNYSDYNLEIIND
jgi:hypothetical protein